MKVNASVMYGHSVYKSQFHPVKAPQFNTPTTNIIDADSIKVIRRKEAITPKAQAVGAEQTIQERKAIYDKNEQVHRQKSLDLKLQKVYKDVFSPVDNPTKYTLAQKLNIDDFNTKILKIVHYRDAFVENMQTLLNKGHDAQQQTEINKQTILHKSVYA